MGDHEGLSTLMEQTDLPLVPVLVDMEKHGIGCSIPAFGALEADLSSRLKGIEEEITARGGEKINLNSPKQVAWLLFEKLGLPTGKTTKTGYSTDISVLEGLSAMGKPFDEVPNLLIEFRELSKMLSGFVQPRVKAAKEGDGIIHGVFEPAVTGTGRLSSRDPISRTCLPSASGPGGSKKASSPPVREMFSLRRTIPRSSSVCWPISAATGNCWTPSPREGTSTRRRRPGSSQRSRPSSRRNSAGSQR
jgi:DNA polymerase-1